MPRHFPVDDVLELDEDRVLFFSAVDEVRQLLGDIARPWGLRIDGRERVPGRVRR